MVDVNVDFILENEEPIDAEFVIEPDVTYTADILLSSASSFHNDLYNRDLPDQHPMSAITGLEDALDGLSDDIIAENNRAIEAEETLDNKIDSEADTRADEITRVEGLISDEETRAKGVEQDLASSIDSNHQAISNHVSNKNNPHEVTKAQVGLGNVENLAPADMPMSTATKNYVDNADTALQGQISTINTTIGGYGNIVTHNVSEFATASQGALADTALQPNDNISELTNNLNYQTSTQVANSIAVETNNRENADINLQSQIDAIVSSSDVFDIVGTYAELQAYDISTVPVNDIIKVLVDSTHAGAATYYRCVETGGVKSWSYIGSEGAYYTKAEADSNFVPQTRTVNSKALSSDITLTANDVGALPSTTVIPTVNDSTVTIQKNGSTVSTFTLNQSSNETVNITVPTKTSDITNDSGFITNADLPTVNDGQLDIQVNGTSIATFTANQSGNTTANIVVPDSATWGNVNGDLEDQTDLMEALDAKQDLLTSDNAGNQIEIVEGGSGEDVTVSGNGSVFLEKAQADSLNSVTISGGLKRSLLPDGYTQYDYISVNGDCYFITNYYPSNITEVKTKTFLHKQPTSPLVCRWTGSPTNDTFGFYMGNVSGRLTVFYGRYSDTKYLNIESVKLNMEHDIYMGVNSITFDGTSYSITRGTFTSTQPIYIGAFNQTGTTLAGMMYGRIYPVEFIEGGRTVKHYIPCKNDSGVVGLYEAISGTFISPASGTAKKGRPYINIDTIPDDYTRIEFLQSTGTQYIDSGVIANFANNKIEQTATVQYTTSNANRELMGTNGYGFWGKNASNKIEAALGQTTVNDNALVKNVISWTTNPDGNALILNVNSNQYTSTASTFVDANYAYYVFALGIRVGSGASASFLCHAKVWDYTIAVDDEVVCYLIPVKRNSDDVLGLYDVVTGTFKTNAGTGTFTAGGIQATPSPSNPLPIVSNNGQLKLGSHGKNLFNKNGSPYLAGAYISSATVSQSTFSITSNANYNIYRIEIKPNTTYTFGLIKANDPRWVVTDGSVILDTGSNSGGGAGTYKTITTGATAKYLFLSVAITGSYKCNDILQLEEGLEHTEYEAFHYVLVAEGITETITDSDNNSATAEMLLSIGDYTDSQEILSGDVTRKVGVIVLDGTEDWGAYATNNGYRSFRVNNFLVANTRNGICTHLPYYNFYSSAMDRECVAIGGNKTTLYINLAGEERTANDMKAWLASQYNAGTPVIIVYPLATETTETVTGQTLTTVDGDNTLSIQASIENLPIEAIYTQKGGTVINWVGTNYYTKSEVQALIAAIPNFSVQVLQQLPQTGEELVLYFIPKNGTAPDVYDEYIWLEDDSSFELIGSTQVDLTGYATETWVQNQGYATVNYVDTGLSGKQATLVSGTNIKTVNSQSLLGSGNITISAPTYTAGTGIDITSNTISVTAPTLTNTATGSDSLTILGTPITYADGINIGKNTVAYGGSSVIIGGDTQDYSTSAHGYCVAIGYGANCQTYDSIAIGYEARTDDIEDVAIGYSTAIMENATESVALGNYAAVGDGTTTIEGGTAIGSYSWANGEDATAIGHRAVASADSAVQIGYGTNNEANSFYVATSSSNNWKMLDNAGLIPDARISSNIARASDIPTVDQTYNGTSTNAQSGTAVAGLLEAIYPVGSVYIGTQATCPMSTVMSGTTWTLISSGKALWTGDGTNGGTTINAGVPDITGSITLRDMAQAQSDADGAFTLDTTAGNGNYTGTNQYTRQYFKANFSASSSNAIYGASNTVQPPAYVVNVWERTA